ncbi:hypothetical protein SAMN05518672_11716 [Chitinophaga sp. CF118]|uniref:hypothetical protein n=1 Tax=Chitinophaga sp. CF118 TaxID=1884367 RepID=UPI0008DFB036|nr:hypothetical protein [Chitinophaga sp. CF118]SFF11046.1 hypothetical protein SAMN05518672_11716 [Chitinophaga sp. CF118]
MRFFIPVIAVAFSTTCYAQQPSINISTVKSNDVAKQYKSLLITGEGNMQARMYMDNVSSLLIEDLKKRNIECHYEYLGDDTKTDTDEAFRKLNNSSYNAVLQMMPIELSEKKRLINQNGLLLRTTSNFKTPVKWSTTRMTNDIDLIITEKSDSIIVWQANLKTIIKPTSKSIYREICDQVLTTMEQNKIIPYK